MKILLLAPHPFFQERGTPIAVDLLVRALSARGDEVDILTFHEGQDREYPNVVIHRINPGLNISGISPGFSLKKIYCDLVLLFKMMAMQRKTRYDLIHAIEESATLAMMVKPFFKAPYVYDMDSVISEQLAEKSAKFKPVLPLVRYFEGLTIKHSQAVVAVCQAIADYAQQYKTGDVFLLKDISLIDESTGSGEVDILKIFSGEGKKIGLYIGNLERYQGIDLLIKALALYTVDREDVCMIIIGGNPGDVQAYQEKTAQMGLDGAIHFIGPRPIQDMAGYMKQADFLVSPRIKGINTPMKVYSYLASGVPVIATSLPTHTQVMDGDIAFLAEDNPRAIAQAITRLIDNPELARAKALAAREFIRREHSLEAFNAGVNRIFDSLHLALDEQEPRA